VDLLAILYPQLSAKLTYSHKVKAGLYGYAKAVGGRREGRWGGSAGLGLRLEF
jgi:hypothetical protein